MNKDHQLLAEAYEKVLKETWLDDEETGEEDEPEETDEEREEREENQPEDIDEPPPKKVVSGPYARWAWQNNPELRKKYGSFTNYINAVE